MLRVMFLTVTAMVVFWTALSRGEDTYAVLAMRLLLVTVLVAGQVMATPSTAWKFGVAVTLVLKLATSVLMMQLPSAYILETLVIRGPHRVLPLICAVFGGTTYSLAMSAWALLEMVALCLYRQGFANVFKGALNVVSLGGHVTTSIALTEDSQAPLRIFASNPDVTVVALEAYYLILAAAFSVALVHYYNIALSDLSDAILARQRFITNMVRAAGARGRGRGGTPVEACCAPKLLTPSALPGRGGRVARPGTVAAGAGGGICGAFRVPQNHEMRTPLVGVIGMADALAQQERPNEGLRSQLSVIVESAQALLGLVNNVVDTAALSARQVRAVIAVWPHFVSQPPPCGRGA